MGPRRLALGELEVFFLNFLPRNNILLITP
jgi:hypothetical protein